MLNVYQAVEERLKCNNSSPPSAAYVSVSWLRIGSDNGSSPVR